MAEKPKPSAPSTSSGANPFPMPAQQENFGSILNLLAVAIAQGSGDPQVKQQVLQDLAGQRQARETAVQRRREFEADLILIDKRTQAQVEGAVQTEKRLLAETPTGQAKAKEAEEFVSPESAGVRRAAKLNAAERDKLATEEMGKEAKQKESLRPLELQQSQQASKLNQLKIAEAQAARDFAADPENVELQKRMLRAKVEREEAEVLETQAKAAQANAKAGATRGGGLTRQQVFQAVMASPYAATRTPAQNVQLAEETYVAGIMPTWLSYIPETVTRKDLDGNVVSAPVTTVQLGAMPASRKAEIAVIMDEIGSKIIAKEMHITVNEQVAYKEALNDILKAAPDAIDIILDDLVQDMFVVSGFESTGAEVEENMMLAYRSLFDLLRVYGINNQILNKLSMPEIPNPDDNSFNPDEDQPEPIE